MKTKRLFIEGTQDQSNGTLRQGFHKLLIQELKGRMPKIVMGNGKTQAIRKFKKNKLSDFSYLLIDLDNVESEKGTELLKYKVSTKEDAIFFMIQEMEAWFLSQPHILDDFYKVSISSKLTKRNPKEIADPVAVLQKATKNTRKGKYHKVKHGTALLELLDAKKLKKSFSEFEKLIDKLSND